MKELGFLLLGFLIVAGPSFVAYIKLWERFGWLESRFNEHQERLRGIGSRVADANERLWGAGILHDHEEQLKKFGVSQRCEGAAIPSNFRKWDL
jgi:hypothetical protein